MKKPSTVKRKSRSLEPLPKDLNFLGFDSEIETKKSGSSKQVQICQDSLFEIPTISLKRDFSQNKGVVKSYRDIPSKVNSNRRGTSKAKISGNSQTSLRKIDSKLS